MSKSVYIVLGHSIYIYTHSSVWYMIRNLRCSVTIDSVLANSKTQNAFLFTANAIFRHDYPQRWNGMLEYYYDARTHER
jgi:hypothetical protein